MWCMWEQGGVIGAWDPKKTRIFVQIKWTTCGMFSTVIPHLEC